MKLFWHVAISACVLSGIWLWYGYGGISGAVLTQDIESCVRTQDRKLQCYEELLLTTLKDKNLLHALDLAARLYTEDAAFADQCHGNLHELGAATYEQYAAGQKISLSPQMAYCGFGFFHGFLEALLVKEGDAEGAGRFCRGIGEELRWERPATSCFHGIGHGITDGTDPRLWGDAPGLAARSLSLCEKIAISDSEKRDCAAGVFNSFVFLFRNPKYGISLDPENPYSFCKTLDIALPFRQACYDQMNVEVLTERSFKEGVALVERTVEPAFHSFAINGLTSVAARDALFGREALGEVSLTCESLPSGLAQQCIRGVVAGIFEFGRPGQGHVQAAAFCLENTSLKRTCLEGYTRAISIFYDAQLQKKACEFISTKRDSIFDGVCGESDTENGGHAEGSRKAPNARHYPMDSLTHSSSQTFLLYGIDSLLSLIPLGSFWPKELRLL